jgi:hypothetical protein
LVHFVASAATPAPAFRSALSWRLPYVIDHALADLLGEQFAKAARQSVLLPDEVLQMHVMGGRLDVAKQPSELLGAAWEDLEVDAGEWLGAVLSADRGHEPADERRVAASEFGDAFGMACVDRREHLGAEPQGFDPSAVGSCDEPPVAAEYHVENHADARDEHEDQHPRERGRGVTLLVDEREHDAHDNGVEENAEEPEVLDR